MKKTNKYRLALLLTVLVAALLALGLTAVAAEEPTVVAGGCCGAEGDGTNLTWTLTDDGTLTISGEGSMLNYHLINDHDFEYSSAPWGQRYYQSVVIGSGVTSIGSNAFSDRDSLKSVTIPDSVTNIGGGAFSDCISLESITIPNSVTSIGQGAFSDCISLQSITIPNSVTSIDRDTFYGCTSLTGVTIGNGVTVLDDYMFAACISLESITIPDSVTDIGEWAFWGCTSLKNVTIGNGVKIIFCNAFENCTSLESITIPDGTEEMSYAFYGCTSLESITIPDSVMYIGCTFSGCTSLKDVYYKGSEEQWDQIIGRDDSNEPLLNANIHFNVADWGCCGAEGDGTNLTWVLTNDGTLTVSGEGAMADYDPWDCKAPWWPLDASVKRIVVENGVTRIGDLAFWGVGTAVESVSIAEGVGSIGRSAFQNCRKVTEFTVPDSVTEIGQSVLIYSDHLKKLTIGSSVTTNIRTSFGANKNLEEIIVSPDNPVLHSDRNCVIETATKTLQLGCKNSVIPADGSVTTIGGYAFADISDLTELNVPQTVTRICMGAFDHTGWYDAQPSGVIYINTIAYEFKDFYAFGTLDLVLRSDCTGVSDSFIQVKINESTTLNSITFPATLQYIGEAAFRRGVPDAAGFVQIPEIYYEGSEEAWNQVVIGDFNGSITPERMHFNWHTHTPGKPVVENETPATCTAAGSYDEAVYCTGCDYEFSRETKTVDALGHSWGEWEVIKQATTEETGLMRRVCQNDPSHVEERVIPKLELDEDGEPTSAIRAFIDSIASFFRGFIDWFLRLFRRP